MKDVLEMFVKDARVCKQLVEIAEKNEATVTLEKDDISGTVVRLQYNMYPTTYFYSCNLIVKLAYYWNNRAFMLLLDVKEIGNSTLYGLYTIIEANTIESIEKTIISLFIKGFVEDQIKRYTGIKKLLEEKLK